ncbi:FtsX-like permease family protein [Alloscardovia macacae]|uniref:ABC transporter permease n=1 Tax=Alloscardovia macacae TaxID=1160091 RepID=A0A261F3L4_9BIFI|nr:FtsX-like permease family protein [Alloscardovia macacae]OZG53702.1 ABC transporter permease [Alloscardovia macacae]
MSKRILHKDIRISFTKSLTRFISILCLIALGSFALVGLYVTGPDMRATGASYFAEHKLADVSVIGDYGIDEANEKAISSVSGIQHLEYGYLKDVTVTNTDTSMRIYSQTKDLSLYELKSGRMPKTSTEIALDPRFESDGKYKLGSTIDFTEKEDAAGHTVLRHHSFTVVGFAQSSELMSTINRGQSTAGTGELEGYGVVTPDAFDSDVYMIARLSFTDTQGLDPYSDEYTQKITQHKKALDTALEDQPSERLAAIKKTYQEKIDEAQTKVDDAKKQLSDAHDTLTEGDKQLADARTQYANGKNTYETKKADAARQLASARAQLNTGRAQLEAAQEQVRQQSDALNQAQNQLSQARAQLDAAQADYAQKDQQVTQLEQAAAAGLLGGTQEEQTQQVQQARAQLNAAKAQLDAKEAEYAQNAQKIQAGQNQLNAARAQIAQKQEELAQGEKTYSARKQQADAQLNAARAQLDEANATIERKSQELADGWAQYNEKEPSARAEIEDGEAKIADAQSQLDALTKPVYSLDTRRELPGSEGYRIYSSVSNIVDALARVFPLVLYFVAALVTLTTMARFVDEERINSGTLKALGYTNRDIVKKFTVYGMAAGLAGSLIGIIAGHLLLPSIVYSVYAKSFSYPRIQLHFYPFITLVALALAFLSTVLPAWLAARKELRDKPTELLLPKAPEQGSRILLECITPLWSRMSFNHKVTARNIFRYKKRMLMTVFGVCGSVMLIFAGFSVQHSVSGINERQFGQIMTYDLIVAEKSGATSAERDAIEKLLDSLAVHSHAGVHYESVTKTAGAHNDKQEIRLIVPESADELGQYIRLQQRANGEALSLSSGSSADGAVISERLAQLTGAQVGSTFTFTDADGTSRTVRISGITEMYTGHFLFMNRSVYEKTYGTSYATNAYLVTLKDRSMENAQKQASAFVALDGVKGVVQNTTMMNQISTIVTSLNRIMQILIIVAILLAVVILYNLTNINVSERIRELSTIKVLGFFNKEVTMYIFRETILLTAAGILVGYGLGDALFQYIITVVPPDEVMFNPGLGAKAFVVPVIVVGVITAALGVLIHHRLTKVDMLQALKSVE